MIIELVILVVIVWAVYAFYISHEDSETLQDLRSMGEAVSKEAGYTVQPYRLYSDHLQSSTSFRWNDGTAVPQVGILCRRNDGSHFPSSTRQDCVPPRAGSRHLSVERT